jgi:alpha-1,4-galacturonosyltransferase
MVCFFVQYHQLPGLCIDLTATILMTQESTAHRSSEQARDAHPRDHQTIASNSYAAVRTTIMSADKFATLPDATIRLIKDQLKRAKTYLGFLASRGNHGFGRELCARTRDIRRALGDTTRNQKLPKKYGTFSFTVQSFNWHV